MHFCRVYNRRCLLYVLKESISITFINFFFLCFFYPTVHSDIFFAVGITGIHNHARFRSRNEGPLAARYSTIAALHEKITFFARLLQCGGQCGGGQCGDAEIPSGNNNSAHIMII